MRINGGKERWTEIKRACSTRTAEPPWCVVMLAAALLRDEEVKASWPQYSATNPATWSVFLVTARRLIFLEYEFGADRYTLQEDINSGREDTIEATVRSAWVRPLSRIVRLEIGGCERWMEGSEGPFNIGNVEVTFDNGDSIGLGFDQMVMDYAEDRARSDDFLNAIRDGGEL